MQTLETKQYLASTLGSLQNTMASSGESELNRKVTKALEKCTACIYSISNEPTLACYCIEEHLIKTGVQLTDRREEMRKLEKQLSGALFDIEFSIDSVKRMKNSNENFKSTQDLIKNAIFCNRQCDYNTLSKRRFQQQMEKDHSVDDFRRITSAASSSGTSREAKRSAFQRFSTSFEHSIEGLASSASVDFKAAISHISQLTSAAGGSGQRTNTSNPTNQRKDSANSEQAATSSKESNDETIKEEHHKEEGDKK